MDQVEDARAKQRREQIQQVVASLVNNHASQVEVALAIVDLRESTIALERLLVDAPPDQRVTISVSFGKMPPIAKPDATKEN